MLCLQVVCVLAATVTVIWAAAPSPCCIDREFEADVGVIGSSYRRRNFNEIEGYSSMSYDGHGHKVTYSTHAVVNGTMHYSRLILDYAAKREYALIGNKCTVYELDIDWRDPCIPANATFLREAIYGYGSNSLYANTWEYTEPIDGSKSTISVTKDTCIPLVTTQYREKAPFTQGQQELVLIYSNFRVGIKNRKVFDMPKACANLQVQKPIGNIRPI